jgi:hypothetical protein
VSIRSSQLTKNTESIMRGLWIAVLVVIVMTNLWSSPTVGEDESRTPRKFAGAATPEGPATKARDGDHQVTYRLDFSDYTGGPIEEWLESKGFRFEEAAKDRNLLALSVQNGALILEAKEQIRGFLYKDSLNIEKFSKVRIEWGILKYPEGASYERQIRNEALMVYISFGHEKISSGNIILPNVPYFIGLYLCKGDKLNTPYLGRYYQEGGRFVCLGHAEPQQNIVSEFDLVTAFRTYFDKSEVPPISGINFGVDTSEAGDEGRAAAFIRTIEFIQ